MNNGVAGSLDVYKEVIAEEQGAFYVTTMTYVGRKSLCGHDTAFAPATVIG